MASVSQNKWLLLIHQIPPKPDYFRVKIWRKLQQVGAIPIKQSVYALPRNEQTYEDMLWILREIISGGGEASLSEASFLEGLSDEQIIAMFNTARDADYHRLSEEIRALTEEYSVKQLHKLKKQFQDIVSIDFFRASEREAAHAAIAEAESLLKNSVRSAPKLPAQNIKGRTWITRKGIYADRMSSAWLIRRFIDSEARFKFVSAKSYRPETDELRFDMAQAEFTHENDLCTFEVLKERFNLEHPALAAIAEIIHDIDLKDEKFSRPETAGITAVFSGIAMREPDDETRLEQGTVLLDSLYEYFSKHH